jgi:hypothetical protein
MKGGKARSLLFFLLLLAVAAMALDASYAHERGSDGQQMMIKRAHVPGIGVIP